MHNAAAGAAGTLQVAGCEKENVCVWEKRRKERESGRDEKGESESPELLIIGGHVSINDVVGLLSTTPCSSGWW